jgi:hypothetical protein
MMRFLHLAKKVSGACGAMKILMSRQKKSYLWHDALGVSEVYAAVFAGINVVLIVYEL